MRNPVRRTVCLCSLAIVSWITCGCTRADDLVTDRMSTRFIPVLIEVARPEQAAPQSHCGLTRERPSAEGRKDRQGCGGGLPPKTGPV